MNRSTLASLYGKSLETWNQTQTLNNDQTEGLPSFRFPKAGLIRTWVDESASPGFVRVPQQMLTSVLRTHDLERNTRVASRLVQKWMGKADTIHVYVGPEFMNHRLPALVGGFRHRAGIDLTQISFFVTPDGENTAYFVRNQPTLLNDVGLCPLSSLGVDEFDLDASILFLGGGHQIQGPVFGGPWTFALQNALQHERLFQIWSRSCRNDLGGLFFGNADDVLAQALPPLASFEGIADKDDAPIPMGESIDRAIERLKHGSQAPKDFVGLYAGLVSLFQELSRQSDVETRVPIEIGGHSIQMIQRLLAQGVRLPFGMAEHTILRNAAIGDGWFSYVENIERAWNESRSLLQLYLGGDGAFLLGHGEPLLEAAKRNYAGGEAPIGGLAFVLADGRQRIEDDCAGGQRVLGHAVDRPRPRDPADYPKNMEQLRTRVVDHLRLLKEAFVNGKETADLHRVIYVDPEFVPVFPEDRPRSRQSFVPGTLSSFMQTIRRVLDPGTAREVYSLASPSIPAGPPVYPQSDERQRLKRCLVEAFEKLAAYRQDVLKRTGPLRIKGCSAYEVVSAVVEIAGESSKLRYLADPTDLSSARRSLYALMNADALVAVLGENFPDGWPNAVNQWCGQSFSQGKVIVVVGEASPWTGAMDPWHSVPNVRQENTPWVFASPWPGAVTHFRLDVLATPVKDWNPQRENFLDEVDAFLADSNRRMLVVHLGEVPGAVVRT